MPLLYYWRPDNYMRDLDNGAGYHLNQLNPLMHSIDIGDTLWAFTRNKSGGYAIVAKLLVKAKTINPRKSLHALGRDPDVLFRQIITHH